MEKRSKLQLYILAKAFFIYGFQRLGRCCVYAVRSLCLKEDDALKWAPQPVASGFTFKAVSLAGDVALAIAFAFDISTYLHPRSAFRFAPRPGL